ncbi:uncharacterized protein LOC119769274 [Culex quinquefasciatus]|uniref:uncharacterized protein LOC119769274 n=1 Tax=Culex quinquefasciatus TaxID=7176 RepID=UPI0018E2CEA6|nr:uncharacterized protein LOC119769274 [Culex quinquefasciatus]XP_038117168.1 uncharacterized protein LOC119769274 [Culex quinquefasciatus]XP_038117175.1 uncharacterized protein LOC119769274 [Culex quinquefasciatus]XP_038117180.1 uncharacterized protein LOC119769274 [Culex quinquefasciatus]XP_038117186.1 uncharacterized protein LOC119769274 [Culex quinquefasciatus]
MPIVSSSIAVVAPFVDYPREQVHDFWRQQQHPLSLLSLLLPLPLLPPASTQIAARSQSPLESSTNVNSTPTTVTRSSTSYAAAAAADADRIKSFAKRWCS